MQFVIISFLHYGDQQNWYSYYVLKNIYLFFTFSEQISSYYDRTINLYSFKMLKFNLLMHIHRLKKMREFLCPILIARNN